MILFHTFGSFPLTCLAGSVAKINGKLCRNDEGLDRCTGTGQRLVGCSCASPELLLIQSCNSPHPQTIQLCIFLCVCLSTQFLWATAKTWCNPLVTVHMGSPGKNCGEYLATVLCGHPKFCVRSASSRKRTIWHNLATKSPTMCRFFTCLEGRTMFRCQFTW